MRTPAAPSEVSVSAGPPTQTPRELTQTATAARRTEGVAPVMPTSRRAVPARSTDRIRR